MIIGLTGGIGSGKSLVARLFALLGYPVFNSDQAAKEVYYQPQVREAVIRLLGADAYTSGNRINKAYIGSRIFSDTDLLHRLNGIIHPAVKESFMRFAAANKGRHIVKETALLFEARLEKEVDRILVVSADDEIRIARVMQRDGSRREDVMRKMTSQLPQEEKIKRAHVVIRNNENELLIEQVLAIHKQLLKE